MKNSLPTLTIGITAYNESATIGDLLLAVVRQDHTRYTLKNIKVICDGSVDTTVQICRSIQTNHKNIIVIDTKKRITKTSKLNYLYDTNVTDLLLTLDGDILPGARTVIDDMVAHLQQSQTDMTAGNLVPVKTTGITPTIIYTMHVLWNEIRYQIPEDHIANLYGAVSLLTNKFAHSFRYPDIMPADEEYLYVKAKQSRGFSFEKKAVFFYHTVKTIKELQLQAYRTSNERFSLVGHFGDSVIHYHDITHMQKLQGTVRMFVKSPVYTVLALLVKACIDIKPTYDSRLLHGKWIRLSSTKMAIPKI